MVIKNHLLGEWLMTCEDVHNRLSENKGYKALHSPYVSLIKIMFV